MKHVYGMMTSTQHGNELSEQEEEQLIYGRRYQQGIEYIQPGTKSGLLGQHKIRYEDQQELEYIRPFVRSMRPAAHVLKYEDQQGIEHIRPPERSTCYNRPERSMCYNRQVLDNVNQKQHGYIYKDHRQGREYVQPIMRSRHTLRF